MPIFEVILNGKSHKMEFSGTPLVSVLLKLVENDFHTVASFEDGEPFFRIRPCRRRQ